MALVSVLLLFSVALLALDFRADTFSLSARQAALQKQRDFSTPTFGPQGQCIQEMNSARHAAGLVNFKQLTDEGWPLEKDGGGGDERDWQDFCERLEDDADTDSDVIFENGTYAFMDLERAETASCSTTVKRWQRAFRNFAGLPPPFAEDEELYQMQNNLSFLALYNTDPDAAIDCRVVTCAGSTATVRVYSKASGAPVSAQGQNPKKPSVLVCMTTPNVLQEGKSPFTQDQWLQITKAINGAGAAALPWALLIASTAIFVSLS